MSLQVTTGANSLIAIGFGISDAAILLSVARRLENWVTAKSGDEQHLEDAGLDEFAILKRGGLVDMPDFNRTWGRKFRVLMNNRPQSLEGHQTEKNILELSRFTAYMTCIVAVLDELSSKRPQDSWRSNAQSRGTANECREFRDQLRKDQFLQCGVMPHNESNAVASALHWLLAGKTGEYTTNSSEIAGVLYCLGYLGFDVISNEGPGLDPEPTVRACHVVYSPGAISGTENEMYRSQVAMILTRPPSTIVSLEEPFESFTLFPTDGKIKERCRQARKKGAKAAEFLKIQVDKPKDKELRNGPDLHYRFVDLGTQVGRNQGGIFQLAFAHAFSVNKEICQNLETVLTEPEDVLDWVHGQITDPFSSNPHIQHYSKVEEQKMNAFTVLQAFFMGYYYALFLSLVDTSSLEMPTVDGSWGYCSVELLKDMRGYCKEAQKGLSRQNIIAILAQLLLSYKIDIQNPARDQWCLGVVDKRTLLAQSLLGLCKTPTEIGRFVLIDVDVGGIPTVRGLVIPGRPPSFRKRVSEKTASREIQERGPDTDFTVYIEPDWETNPDNIVLCFRYKERKVGLVNPSVADLLFCYAYVDPVEMLTEGPQRALLPAIECELSDFQQEEVVIGGGGEAIILVQVYGRPLMRYAAIAFYGKTHLPAIMMATICLDTATQRVREKQKTNGIVFAGQGPWKEPEPFKLELKRKHID